MAGDVIDVETWVVRRSGGHFDATIWAPKGSTAQAAQALARQEHGANATAVHRLDSNVWHPIKSRS